MDDELENLNREQLARRLANLVRIGVVEDADTIACVHATCANWPSVDEDTDI